MDRGPSRTTYPEYVLTLRPLHPGEHPQRRLALLLKRLLREGGFRCIEVHEVKAETDTHTITVKGKP